MAVIQRKKLSPQNRKQLEDLAKKLGIGYRRLLKCCNGFSLEHILDMSTDRLRNLISRRPASR